MNEWFVDGRTDGCTNRRTALALEYAVGVGGGVAGVGHGMGVGDAGVGVGDSGGGSCWGAWGLGLGWL